MGAAAATRWALWRGNLSTGGWGCGVGNPSSEDDRSPSVINPLGRLKQLASTPLLLSVLFGAQAEGIASPLLSLADAAAVVVDVTGSS